MERDYSTYSESLSSNPSSVLSWNSHVSSNGQDYTLEVNQCKTINGTQTNSCKHQIKENYKLDRFSDEWHDYNRYREMNPFEIKWIGNTVNTWNKMIERSLHIGPIVWSWLRHKWIEYDIDTNRFLEEEYSKFNEGINEEKQKDTTFYVELNCGNFRNNQKLSNQYRIYFSASNIKLPSDSYHSPSNPKWKNDNDGRNSYFLQENYVTKKFRIVRRRNVGK